MISCENLSSFSGWECNRAPDGSLYISTPVLLHDGTPLGFFLTVDGATARFSDEGMTIFALRNMGIDMTDRRNWRGLESIAQRLGFSVADDGEVTLNFPVAESTLWFSNITRLMSSVADWQQERFEQNDTHFNLTREVEELLKEKGPSLKLEVGATVMADGKPIRFDFLWGNTYIDAIPAEARATSSRLRKAIMARPLELHGDNILIIVDDRIKPERAKNEIAVLSQVAAAEAYTSFAKRPIYH